MLGDKVTVSYSVEPTEKELYEESRRLKFMAREKRKIREAREAADLKARQDALEEQRRDAADRKVEVDIEYKKDLDNRIRLAMTNLAACMKEQGLAFEAPSMFDTRKYLNAFSILDVSKSDPARSGARIQIRTMHNGFNWD